MSSVNELHDKSMDFAAIALMEQMRGNEETARPLFEQALELEIAAINAMTDQMEPTYSILHRSAATLALDCNDLRQAERLAAKALSEEPPYVIAEELREVLEHVKFRRRMEETKIEFNPDEIQMTLDGPAVGVGFIYPRDIFGRIEGVIKLMTRTAERLMDVPFRQRGQPGRMIRDYFQPWISVPRAGSFIIGIKFTSSTGQLSFPEMSVTADVIEEFMDLMASLDSPNISELQVRIPDHAYLSNFLGLAREIAPDGSSVDKVGLSSNGTAGPRSVVLTKLGSSIPVPPPIEPTFVEPEPVELQGTLRFADSIDQDHKSIKIVDSEGNTFDIRVSPGMMDVIMPSHWDIPVVITGLRTDKIIELQQIDKLEHT